MSDVRLLAQIKRRRNDPEFMGRLRQMVEDDRDVLERLADGPVEERSETPRPLQLAAFILTDLGAAALNEERP